MRHSAIRTNYNITTISALIQPEHSYVCTESIALHTVRLQASLRLNVMSLGSIRSLVSIVYCPIAFSHLLTSFILMCLCIRGTEKRLSFIPIVQSFYVLSSPLQSQLASCACCAFCALQQGPVVLGSVGSAHPTTQLLTNNRPSNFLSTDGHFTSPLCSPYVSSCVFLVPTPIPRPSACVRLTTRANLQSNPFYSIIYLFMASYL